MNRPIYFLLTCLGVIVGNLLLATFVSGDYYQATAASILELFLFAFVVLVLMGRDK